MVIRKVLTKVYYISRHYQHWQELLVNIIYIRKIASKHNTRSDFLLTQKETMQTRTIVIRSQETSREKIPMTETVPQYHCAVRATKSEETINNDKNSSICNIITDIIITVQRTFDKNRANTAMLVQQI